MEKKYKITIAVIFLFILTMVYKSIHMNPKVYAIIVCSTIIYLTLDIIKGKKDDKNAPLYLSKLGGLILNPSNFYGKIAYILLIVLVSIFLVLVVFFHFPLRLS